MEAETILTAQHDKEMEEFLCWCLWEEIVFDSDSGNCVFGKHACKFSEILEHFRKEKETK